MLITLSRRTAICQSVTEVYLTGVALLGAVSHRFNFNSLLSLRSYNQTSYSGRSYSESLIVSWTQLEGLPHLWPDTVGTSSKDTQYRTLTKDTKNPTY